MKWLLLLLSLVPSATALSIAASPDHLHLGPQGEAALRLFNPNAESVTYVAKGAHLESVEGTLEPQSYTDVTIKGKHFFGEDTLVVRYFSTRGNDHITVDPALQIRVLRERYLVSRDFSLVYIGIILLFLCIGVVVLWIL